MSHSDLQSILAGGLEGLAIAPIGAQRHSLLTLIDELSAWNARFNLTAIRDPADMVRKHLLDSLSIQPYLYGETVADVGSGAGFPGLPLAVINPDRKFTLIESVGKKARFIEHAATALRLTNVQVVNARAEAYRPAQLFDTVTARALSKIADFIRFTEHFCAPGGRLLAMKGQYPHEELQAVPKRWQVVGVHALEVPGLDAERHLVELTR